VSPRLPALTGQQIIAVLRRHGFDVVRQSGSHLILNSPDGRRTTVPLHAGRDLGRGLLRQIMRDAKLSVEDLTS
jgi:predicted RNA binding protein YcfA (HicA-like mRNA interferase family)